MTKSQFLNAISIVKDEFNEITNEYAIRKQKRSAPDSYNDSIVDKSYEYKNQADNLISELVDLYLKITEDK